MANSKNDKPEKVFDVTKPGKTPASANSRPMIVGHKPMMTDPMVKEAAIDELDQEKTIKIDQPIEEDMPSGSPPLPADDDMPSLEAEPTQKAPSESGKRIEPLSSKSSGSKSSADDSSDTKVTVKVSKPTDKPIASTNSITKVKDNDQAPDEEATKNDSKKTTIVAGGTTVETAKAAKDDSTSTEKTTSDSSESSEPETKEEKTDSTEETESEKEPEEKSDAEAESDSSDSAEASDDDGVPASTEAQKKAEKEAQEAAAKNEQLEKLVTSKQYFVPIGEKTRKKRSLRRMLSGLLLILVLGGALVYLMIDVGIIKTSYKLPYHFFKQTATISSDSQVATNTTSAASTTQSNTYTSKVAGVSFTYPKDWVKTTDSASGNKQEYSSFVPSADPTGNASIVLKFTRYNTGAVDAYSPTLKLAKVSYTPLKDTNGKTLYLREAIMSVDGAYALYLNVTDKQVDETVDSIPGLNHEFFTSADEKSVLDLEVTPITYDGKTLDSVTQYSKTDKSYLAAKAALSSVKFVKQ